jgi:hypothetical protein
VSGGGQSGGHPGGEPAPGRERSDAAGQPATGEAAAWRDAIARPPASAAETSLAVGERVRRFALALLLTGLGLVLAVGALNAIVDPLGIVGTGLFPTKVMADRQIKADLVAALPEVPQVVIFGSSRAWKLNPEFIRAQTGLVTFNASVSGGRPADAWAFANLIHDRIPAARPNYIWILDVSELSKVQLAAGLLNVPELRKYFPSGLVLRSRLKDVSSLFSFTTARDSLSILRNLDAIRAKAARQRRHWSTWGWFTDSTRDVKLDANPGLPNIQADIKDKSAIYRDYAGPDPQAKHYLEKTLALFASWGGHGIIVIPPSEPGLITALMPVGWGERHQQVVDYLATLHTAYDFSVVDMTSLSSYGGSATGFIDGVHLRTPEMNKMMAKVLEIAGDQLR